MSSESSSSGSTVSTNTAGSPVVPTALLTPGVNCDRKLWTMVVHNSDITVLTCLSPDVTIGQLKKHYLETLRNVEHRLEKYVPADEDSLRLYRTDRAEVVPSPLSDDAGWWDLEIPFIVPKSTDEVFPAEFVVATFRLPNGTWELPAYPKFEIPA